jgi:signal transduction histidine kinase
MLIRLERESTDFKQADLEFHSIMANQLAMTLENVSLLDETRRAFSRLRELQDETIELEKMATRGAMSAEIGHELNNFLGVVSGNVSLMQMHIDSGALDKLKPLLDKVTKTIERMTTFTADLMDLGSMKSHREPVSFSRLLEEVVEYLTAQKRFRGVTIHLPSQLPDLTIMVDATQMRQLLYNLFNNAADAMQSSPLKRIDVELVVNDNPESVAITIADTGTGFDPDTLARAFKEQFTTKPNGHGFGLVVCGRIIENHGGTIQVDSTPNVGTRITITLPATADSEQRIALPV